MTRNDIPRYGSYSGSASSPRYISYANSPYSPPPALVFAMAVLVVASLAIGVYSLVGVNDLKSKLLPRAIDAKDFVGRLASHAELSAYKGVNPTNVVQITQQNLGQLQQQIAGLDVGHIGKFLVQYADRIVLYDYNKDVLEAQFSLPQGQIGQGQPNTNAPQDFFTKLAAHPEAQPFMTSNPVGGQLDEASLASLKQQFPNVYNNAKTGDYLLRFPTGLVVFDYNQDKVVTAVPLQQQ